MTAETLYDPRAPEFLDPADARSERDRTFQICADCRLCVKYCFSFKSLFELIDAAQEQMGPNADHHDATLQLTDANHERIVDECFQCKLCYINCPYTLDKPEAEWKIDFPDLMLRSLAIKARDGKVGMNAKLLARTDLQGKVATTFSGVVNGIQKAGFARGLMEKTTGIAKSRLLPSWNKVRFSKWFARRGPSIPKGEARTPVAMFPTCLVEYQNNEIGKAAVAVYEHNGIACELPEGQVCCGMPWLDAGDTKKFAEQAEKNVNALLPAVEAGKAVVVPQATCARCLKHDYPSFLGTEAGQKVADSTYDVSEYLMKEHKDRPLDTDFTGETYAKILWHQPCHYQAQQIGPQSAAVMRLTGAKVEINNRCSAIDGTWGLREENVDMARKIAKPLMEKVAETDADIVVGDCNLANDAITQDGGKKPVHPMQVLARAYGIEEDSP
ncbi:MAG: heterodisulfide reductase-related iron-sulfur binding cluster [Acidimicrobiia bacterium]